MLLEMRASIMNEILAGEITILNRKVPSWFRYSASCYLSFLLRVVTASALEVTDVPLKLAAGSDIMQHGIGFNYSCFLCLNICICICICIFFCICI